MTIQHADAEDTRQLVHVAVGGFAFLLPALAWWQSVVLACAAVAFNIFAIQKVLGIRVFRPGERLRRLTSGIVLYPLSVLLLLLVFGSRLDIVAAAWGILALGDGMATLIGRRWPLAPLPWNHLKSVGGTLSFAAFGGLAAIVLAWWCRETVVPPAYAWYPLVGGLTAAIVAAAVESVPVKLDDNVSVTASAAATLWIVSLVNSELAREAARTLASTLPLALTVNLVIAAGGYYAGTVTVSGVVAGAALGIIIFVFAGWAGWALLVATFAAAVISSRIGLRRKTRLGIAEAHGGRRGAGNAIANTGVAAVAAIMAALTYAHDAALLAFVAALAAGGSDTVASEIGKAWGRTTYLVTTARRVPAGTSGAVSLEGTAAGIAGALALGGLGAALGLVDPSLIVVVVVAALLASLVESVLGATLEHRGIMNNDMLNFMNTAAAAIIAVELARFA